MARLAIILRDGNPGWRELRLGLILDFFGVPSKTVQAPELSDLEPNGLEYALFGSVRVVAATLKQWQGSSPPALPPAAIYAYSDDERSLCSSALQSLLGDANLSLQEAPPGNLSLRVSDDLTDLTGP